MQFFTAKNRKLSHSVFHTSVIQFLNLLFVIIAKARNKRTVSLIFYTEFLCCPLHHLRAFDVQLCFKRSRLSIKAGMNNRRICLACSHCHIVFFFKNTNFQFIRAFLQAYRPQLRRLLLQHHTSLQLLLLT